MSVTVPKHNMIPSMKAIAHFPFHGLQIVTSSANAVTDNCKASLVPSIILPPMINYCEYIVELDLLGNRLLGFD